MKVTRRQDLAKLPSPKYFVTVQQGVANIMTKSHAVLQCNNSEAKDKTRLKRLPLNFMGGLKENKKYWS